MICLLGITGNLLVAIVLIRVPSLRSNTSDFLIHLSLVDFIVCVLVIPVKLVPTTGKSLPNPGFFGELRCRVYVSQYLFWICALISVLGLVTVNLGAIRSHRLPAQVQNSLHQTKQNNT